MNVSSHLAEVIAEKGVPAVFELVGGTITHLLDAIHLLGKTPIVSMRHEQGAAFAAEAAGRLSGVPGIALATSGPGATNLLTGIASCYYDSTPAIFITGQVNSGEQKGDRLIRQLGFQEADIVSMAQTVVKRAWRVEHEDAVPTIFEEAFSVAMSGRKGPVLIDIPMNFQSRAVHRGINRNGRYSMGGEPHADPLQADTAREILEGLRNAERPLILAGGGLRAAGAVEQFRAFARAAGVPVVHSLMAIDTLPYGHPLRVGMIGSYGNRWANLALSQCDCLLVLGSRLDVRQTGSKIGAFEGGRQIFHIDCDAAEMNNRIKGCVAAQADLTEALETLRHLAAGQPAALDNAWHASIRTSRALRDDTAELAHIDGINPNLFMHQLSGCFRHASMFVVDVGQHQMWAAQSLELQPHQRFLTSGGMGAMGFALPAAVGASFCGPGEIVLIAGDGGFQCNIQELQTLVHHRAPVKMVVLNNNAHGMVRQFQESNFQKRYQSTVWGYSAPDFERIAAAYGIPAMTVAEPSATADALRWLAREPGAPALLQVMISPEANAWPKVPYGSSLADMEPVIGR